MTSLLSNIRVLDLSRILSGPWPPCTTATRPPARVSAWAWPYQDFDCSDGQVMIAVGDDTAIVALQEQGVIA